MFRQLSLLLYKAMLQKWRSPVTSALELLMPAVLVGAIIGLYYAESPSTTPRQDFVKDTAPLVPFGVLPRQLDGYGWKLGVVAGDGHGAKAARDSFASWLDDRYPEWDGSTLGGIGFQTPGLRDFKMPAMSKVVKKFDSVDDLNSYVADPQYDTDEKPRIVTAWVFDSGAPDFGVTVRMNSSDAPLTVSNVDIVQREANTNAVSGYAFYSQELMQPKGQPHSGSVYQGLSPGFLSYQVEADRWIIQSKTPLPGMGANGTLPDAFYAIQRASLLLSNAGVPGDVLAQEMALWNNPNETIYTATILGALYSASLEAELYAPNAATYTPFPIEGYTTNGFYGVIQNFFALFFVLAVAWPVLQLIRVLVTEKENRIREGMRMMGLGEFVLPLSWLIIYMILFAVLALIIAAATASNAFKSSSFGAIFLFFFLFGLSSTALSFFIATFFSKARTAMLLGFLVFLGLWFPYMSVANLGTPESTRMWAALASPTAFSLGLTTLANLEDQGAGVTPENIAQEFQGWRFSNTLWMLLLDSILYLVLAWYADNVLPSWMREYGLPRPWYFPVTPSYWAEVFPACRRGAGGSSEEAAHLRPAQSGPFIETLGRELQNKAERGRSVAIRGLTKQFGNFTAVDHIDMDLFEGQIFVLLGHNGAGKTTTISMLTGLLPSTEGSASVFGRSIHGEMDAIRHSLGVCPQHDVLWPELTVSEHLHIYAGIKGVPKDKVDDEILTGLRDVGLTEKIHARAGSLSGGQKRKLSVCIALIGGSKVVVLDEPTSGMDPYSRRSTWQVLQNARRDRVLLLTTHFMEEADLLGDRICIMSHGKVQCCGSPLFLKSKYGVGYQMTAIKHIRNGPRDPLPSCDADAVIDAVTRTIEGAEVTSNVGSELSFRLPVASSARFPDLFHLLDDDIAKPPTEQRFRILSYGVGVTTMEEVFLRVARGESVAPGGGATGGASGSSGAGASGAGSASEGTYGALAGDESSGAAGGGGSSSDKDRLLGRGGGDGASSMRSVESVEPTLETVRAQARKEGEVFVSHFKALLWKRFHNYKRDAMGFCCQILLPILVVVLGLVLLRIGQQTTFPRLVFSTAAFNYNQQTHSNLPNIVPAFDFYASPEVYDFEPADAKLTGALAHLPNTTVHKVSAAQAPMSGYFVHPNQRAYDAPSFVAGSVSHYVLQHRADQAASIYGAYSFPAAMYPANGSSPPTTAFEYQAFVNTTALHGAPTFTNLMDTALYRAISGNHKASITAASHPLPFTNRQEVLISTVVNIFASLVVSIAFSFVPTSYAVFLVKEREVNAKHQQLISGVSIPAFWVSTFVWDFVTFQIPCWLTLAVLAGFNVKSLVDGAHERLGATVLLLFCYGFAAAPFTYLLSYLFKSHSNAQVAVIVINLIAMLLMIASFIMGEIESTCHVDASLRYVYRLVPGFSLGSGLLALSFLEMLPFFALACDSGADYNALQEKFKTGLKWDVAGADVCFLLVTGVVYFALAIAVDYGLSHPELLQRFSMDPMDPPAAPRHVDRDVAAEESRVTRLTGADEEVVVVNKLRKTYPGGKHAVRGISFGIPIGEVFGFLGVNGAGKTSTLKILSGDIVPTAGQARLAGYDVLREQMQCRRLLGYCPQFDALLELLTVREHLELFARIKNVPEADVEAVVADKVREMDLSAYVDVRAGALSGGNKRKLSVAIALIGDPPIVFLDEPSTGMDPMARRHMWDVIMRVATQRRSCSIILTTHSMEECEALCQRVAIMVSGRLQCLGSIQHLKNRFGGGYTCEIRMGSPPAEAAEALLEQAQRVLGREGMTMEDRVTRVQTLDIARSVHAGLPGQISPVGTGWALDADLSVNVAQGIPVGAVLSWVASEEANRAMVQHIMHEAFPPTSEGKETRLVEQHGPKFRFSVPEQPDMRLGEMFRRLETMKGRFHVDDYSLAQASLEYVFNSMARLQEEETQVVRGVLEPAGAAAPSKPADELTTPLLH